MSVQLHKRTALVLDRFRRVRRLGVPTLLTLCALVILPAAGHALVLDSFTDALPPHPLLPVTGAPVLFLGTRCDGAACPPATMVTGAASRDTVKQAGLKGVFSEVRHVTLRTFFLGSGGVGLLAIEPADGGRLELEAAEPPALALALDYGSRQTPLNLDLRADGSDRLELDILAAPQTRPLIVGIRFFWNEGLTDMRIAARSYQVSVAGTLVAPFTDFAGLEDFAHDVESMDITFFGFGTNPGPEFALGEIRTVAAPVPAKAATWGRVKNTYRR